MRAPFGAIAGPLGIHREPVRVFGITLGGTHRAVLRSFQTPLSRSSQ